MYNIFNTVFGWTNLCGSIVQEDGLLWWNLFGYINLAGWIGEDLQDVILANVKRFEKMKLKIMKQSL